ncbi:MAG: hypothetical protein DWI57_02800 [Chloroflexi bacterium]|nr:MAG: hypothetical protein DWI57_02800 [Chloroflexota bacterium]
MDESRAQLGGAANPTLMPAYYLYAVLPKIGGCGLTVQRNGQTCGYGFLFPRQMEGDTPVYTLRYHRLAAAPPVDADELTRQTARLLALRSRVIFYDPLTPKSYAASHRIIGELDLGRPDESEAAAIRAIHRTVWNNPPEILYPVDMHSTEFALPTSLVARADGQSAGFLFGMTKFGGTALPAPWQERLRHGLRLESQTMGVLPAFRGRHIAFLLKKAQAQDALALGIEIINWTADPLQFANASLNFTRLGALAYEFQPDLYVFRNELNRVAASRLNLTWLVGSQRVQERLSAAQSVAVVALAGRPEVVRVNDGHGAARFDADAATIAFEIPADWTALQRDDLLLAQRWRETTDRLFLHYLGKEEGRYIITSAGVDGERRYLLGERVDERLLESLCPPVIPKMWEV